MANKALDMANMLSGNADNKLHKSINGLGVANAEIALNSAKGFKELKSEITKNNEDTEKHRKEDKEQLKQYKKRQIIAKEKSLKEIEKRADRSEAIQKNQSKIFKSFALDMKAQLKISKDMQNSQDKNRFSTASDSIKASSVVGDDAKDATSKSKGLFGKLAVWAAILGTQMSDFAEKVMSGVKVGLKAFKPVMGFFKKIGKFASGIGGVIRKISGTVGKLFGGAGKLAGKGIGKTMLKVGGKLGLSALKKIPGLGALIGIALGVKKFSKGDNIGGIMEIASGLVSIVPGFGTAASMVIDAAIIAKDMGAFKDMSIMGMLGMGGSSKPVKSATRRETASAQKAKSGVDSSFSNYGVKQSTSYSPTEFNTTSVSNGSSATSPSSKHKSNNAPTVSGLSKKGEDYIKSHEGLSLEPYWDYKGYSAGYGHLFPGTTKGNPPPTLTQSEADAYFSQDIAKYSGAVAKNFGDTLTDNQMTAMTSFAYNLGVGILPRFKSLVASGDTKGVTDKMRLYNKAGGKVHPGLEKRRNDEANLYANPHFAAKGAVLNRPVIAGEAGPEAIIPLNDRGINVISEAMNKHMNLTGSNNSLKDNSAASMSGMKQFLSSSFIPLLANELAKAMQTVTNNNSQSHSITAIG